MSNFWTGLMHFLTAGGAWTFSLLAFLLVSGGLLWWGRDGLYWLLQSPLRRRGIARELRQLRLEPMTAVNATWEGCWEGVRVSLQMFLPGELPKSRWAEWGNLEAHDDLFTHRLAHYTIRLSFPSPSESSEPGTIWSTTPEAYRMFCFSQEANFCWRDFVPHFASVELFSNTLVLRGRRILDAPGPSDWPWQAFRALSHPEGGAPLLPALNTATEWMSLVAQESTGSVRLQRIKRSLQLRICPMERLSQPWSKQQLEESLYCLDVLLRERPSEMDWADIRGWVLEWKADPEVKYLFWDRLLPHLSADERAQTLQCLLASESPNERLIGALHSGRSFSDVLLQSLFHPMINSDLRTRTMHRLLEETPPLDRWKLFASFCDKEDVTLQLECLRVWVGLVEAQRELVRQPVERAIVLCLQCLFSGITWSSPATTSVWQELCVLWKDVLKDPLLLEKSLFHGVTLRWMQTQTLAFQLRFLERLPSVSPPWVCSWLELLWEEYGPEGWGGEDVWREGWLPLLRLRGEAVWLVRLQELTQHWSSPTRQRARDAIVAICERTGVTEGALALVSSSSGALSLLPERSGGLSVAEP